MCYPDPMPIAINMSQKMVKIMDSRVESPSKSNVPYPLRTISVLGAKIPASHMEVKVAKLPIEKILCVWPSKHENVSFYH